MDNLDMTVTPKTALVAALYRLHDIETGNIPTLKAFAQSLDGDVPMRDQIHSHIDQTHQQRRAVLHCLLQLEPQHSLSAGLSESTLLEACSRDFSRYIRYEPIAVGYVALFGLKQMEIALYMQLGQLARQAQEPSVVEVSESILVQEQAMAAVLREALARSDNGEHALLG